MTTGRINQGTVRYILEYNTYVTDRWRALANFCLRYSESARFLYEEKSTRVLALTDVFSAFVRLTERRS
jgi:hypothetical protein